MDMQELEITIDNEGRIQVKVTGAHGAGCLEMTKNLEHAAGDVEGREGLPARFCKSFSFFPSLSAILKPAAIRAAARGKDRYRCTAVRENGFFNGAEGGPRGQQKCVGYPAGGWKLLRLPANKTICPYGHEDLEPGSFSGRPRFADSHTGEREDFPGKEQAE